MKIHKLLIKRTAFLGILISISLLPLIVYAVEQGGISNPLGNVKSISELLTNIARFLLGLVGILTLLAIVVAGIRMIISIGREEELRKSKTILLWAILGLAVVMLSYFIIRTIEDEFLT